MAEEFIKGYRPQAERPKERQLSYDYMLQSEKASRTLQLLWKTPGKNCEGRMEEYSGDEFPTDRQAERLCAGCPARALCETYATEAHPAWGLWGGKVRGRKLKEAMEDD